MFSLYAVNPASTLLFYEWGEDVTSGRFVGEPSRYRAEKSGILNSIYLFTNCRVNISPLSGVHSGPTKREDSVYQIQVQPISLKM